MRLCVPTGQCTGTPRRARATFELLRMKRQTFLGSTCGLRTAQISVLSTTRSGLLCNIASTTVLKRRLLDVCMVRCWTFDFWRGYWPVARKTLSVCPC